MRGRPVPVKLWVTIQEPRIVTFLTMVAYIVCFLSGWFIIGYSVEGNGVVYDPLAWLTGIIFILVGAVGIPVAWTGKHWIEAGVALGMALGGFLVVLTLGIAYWVHRTIYSFGPDALFIVTWASMGMIFGLTRFERCRLAPYAYGKGPLLPDHRKAVAVHKMNQDWEKLKNREE